MATSSQVWDRQLNSEERQYLRDLASHPGYLLLMQALSDLMLQDLTVLLDSKDMWELANMQGKYKRSQEVLDIPSKLLQSQSPLRNR